MGSSREDLSSCWVAATQFGAVIFDLFGTLVPNFSMLEMERVLYEMATLVNAPPQQVVRLWLEIFPQRAVGTFPMIGANIAHICQTLDVSAEEGVVSGAAELWLALERRALIPRVDAIETLSRVRAAGLKIGLISDCSHPLPEVWPDTPFASLIHAPVFSCEAGMRKPDPRIYSLGLQPVGGPAGVLSLCWRRGESGAHGSFPGRDAGGAPACS